VEFLPQRLLLLRWQLRMLRRLIVVVLLVLLEVLEMHGEY
jgi:hypothetical protein